MLGLVEGSSPAAKDQQRGGDTMVLSECVETTNLHQVLLLLQLACDFVE